jgi:cytoskeleton protein RodZ
MNEASPLIPMTTGERFMKRRVELGLSLADVSAAIKLNERLLSDIEEGRELAVARVYRNGFIRTYAAFLGIAAEDIEGLVNSPGDAEPGVRRVFSMPAPRNLADKWLRATSYVLASLLIGTLAWQFTYEAVRLSQDEPQADTDTVISSTGKSAGPEGIEGTVEASIAPLGALHDNTSAAGDTAEQAWAAISRPPLAEGESRLQVSVSADSWIEIMDATGQELEMDLLRGGSEKDYVGQPPFSILVGRAPAVRLAVDGQDVDLAAYTRDDVARLTWPPEVQDEE